MKNILTAIFLIKITTVSSTFQLWDKEGSKIQASFHNHQAKTTQVPKYISMETKDPDCGIVPVQIQVQGKYTTTTYNIRVECGNGARYVELNPKR